MVITFGLTQEYFQLYLPYPRLHHLECLLPQPPLLATCPNETGRRAWQLLSVIQLLAVQLYNCTTHSLYNCTTVQLYKFSTVQLFLCTTVQLFNCAVMYHYITVLYCTTILLYNSTTVQQYNCAPVQVYNYTVQLYNCTAGQLLSVLQLLAPCFSFSKGKI